MYYCYDPTGTRVEHAVADVTSTPWKERHAYVRGPPGVHLVDKALYACDELTGLITAAALVRPNGVLDLSASSVKKKMKSKGFARNVNRDDITRGAVDFGVDLTEHIQFLIDTLKPLAAELGLEKGLAESE